jgi:hypothetical protein
MWIAFKNIQSVDKAVDEKVFNHRVIWTYGISLNWQNFRLVTIEQIKTTKLMCKKLDDVRKLY